MCQKIYIVGIGLLLCNASLFAFERTIHNELVLSSSAVYNTKRESSPLPREDNRATTSVEYFFGFGGLQLREFLQYEQIGDTARGKFVGREINYTHRLDTAGSWEVTVGKKLLDWGVGFNFRPLNVAQTNATRLDIVPQHPEGTLQLRLLRLGETYEVQFIVYKPHTEDGPHAAEYTAEKTRIYFEESKTAGAVYASGYLDDFDWYFIAQKEEQSGALFGAAINKVIGDQTAIYLSGVSVRDSFDYNFIDNQSPDPRNRVAITKKDVTTQRAVIGINYTTLFNINVIGELSYDGRAPSNEFWHDYLSFVDQYSGSSGLPPETGRLFGRENAYQKNAFIRFSYLEPANWDIELRAKRATDINSGSVTAQANYQILPTLAVEFGARGVFGEEKSAHFMQSNATQFFATLEWQAVQ